MNTFMKCLLRLASLLLLGSMMSAVAKPQFPERPLRFVVPYAAGGSADQLARVLAEYMAQNLGQPVVIENKPGASTRVAAVQVARAPADGYTIFLASNSSMVLNPLLYRKLDYQAHDFRVISVTAEMPLVLVANRELPADTLGQFVAHARSQPGRLNYASVGLGNPLQLTTELFKSRAGIDLVHVPYNGSAPALASLMANDTQVMIDVISTSLPLVREHKLKALAVASAQRLDVLPDVPTVAESGYPGFHAATWFGVSLPAATPSAVVQRLQQAIDAALSAPDFRARFQALGLMVQAPRSQADIDTYVENDRTQWAQVIRRSNIQLD
ncbi:Bug family tripartite tricarboxylate transporter substrate binding protein [Bordetella petrii]|uniref:Bug family tripartite tricarboxylate transporter substrate binding protein n=1 Tax=Bordetella petrii TaxID=94624 RepID=UPI001E5A1F14|nr:tripartite tricarboxylate transporter substrate binding protein [Bordetella petrii]MCD0504376.1 tripartite tricarboxylate transporter substrate binding protein [Bordetella petrii]